MTRSAESSTYDEDFFVWTQQQAAALRRGSSRALGNEIDIEHVAGEIEDLGKRDLREVNSHLARLFEHLIRINSYPTAVDVPHWMSESGHFHDSAVDAYSPSMRRLIDVEKIWRRGRQRAEHFLQASQMPLAAPSECPFMLEELLSDDFAIDAALKRLADPP